MEFANKNVIFKNVNWTEVIVEIALVGVFGVILMMEFAIKLVIQKNVGMMALIVDVPSFVGQKIKEIA